MRRGERMKSGREDEREEGKKRSKRRVCKSKTS